MELNNKLICDFMQNYTYQSDSGVNWIEINGYPFAEFNDAPFHLSYDWIMPVIEKIESLDYVSVYFSKTYLGNHKVEISKHTPSYKLLQVSKTVFCEHESRLEATYKAVVEFIKWYNQNKDGNSVA